MDWDRINRGMRHAWSEPKNRAMFEWWELHPPFGWLNEIPRDEVVGYINGEGWAHPERKIRISLPPPEPDWDWWEPRYDTPDRRKVTEDRLFDETGEPRRADGTER